MIILFICQYNVYRSQLAQALFNKFSKRNKAISAGTNHLYEGQHYQLGKAPNLVTYLSQFGLSLEGTSVKVVNQEMIDKADKVIVLMSGQEADTNLPSYIRDSSKCTIWEVPDSSVDDTKRYNEFAKAGDDIKGRIMKLVSEIG